MTIRKSTCRFLSVFLALVFLVGLIPNELITFKAKADTSGYYTYFVTNGEAGITDVDTSINGNITIPSTLGGYPVTSIGYRAFEYCESITSITIPDSVTSIGNYAFYCCYDLTSITIPESVTSIGGSAFYNCESLTSITIPDGVTSIGEYAFSSCSSLTAINVNSQNTKYKSIDGVLCSKDEKTLITCPDGKTGDFSIPESVTSIEDEAFYDCTSLTSITIPDSVTIIRYRAFEGCTSLTSITIPDSVTIIAKSAFSRCRSLTSITIPDSVTSIGDNAFSRCDSLTSITIPDSVTFIGDSAFSGCDSLTEIKVSSQNTKYKSIDGVLYSKDEKTLITCPEGKTGDFSIPDSVTRIGDNAFSCCDSLTSITIPDGVTNIGEEAFYFCTSLKSITIPDGIKSIGYEAFGYCTSLTSITIPDGVTSIVYEAFWYCTSLTSITIPDSVTSIVYGAFWRCNSLKDVWYTGTEEQKNKISIEYDNTELTSATWHYNTCKEHTYTSLCDAECDLCDWVRETEAEHTYTNSSDTTCNECGKERIAPDSEYYFDEAKGTMPNVLPKTTVGTLKDGTNGKITVVYDLDGNVVADTENVGTGYKVVADGKEYTVIVKGDLDGDGAISTTDYCRIKMSLLGDYQLEGIYADAADADKNGKITSTDFMRIKAAFIGGFEH